MNTTRLGLSDLVKESVCTYRGPLRYLWDELGEFLRNDLDDIKTKDDKINVEGMGLIDLKRVYIDFNMDDGIWNYIINHFKDNIDTEKLAEAMKKYGLTFVDLYFWKNPGAYNFKWDSLDIKYEYDDDIDWKEKYPELIPYVEKYIKEVRQGSYDGYCSFEPTDINKVGMDDYCYLWAILTKENLYDEVKAGIQGGVEDILTDSPYEFDRSTIVIDDEDGHTNWDTKYYVDYDEKILREIKN